MSWKFQKVDVSNMILLRRLSGTETSNIYSGKLWLKSVFFYFLKSFLHVMQLQIESDSDSESDLTRLRLIVLRSETESHFHSQSQQSQSQ